MARALKLAAATIVVAGLVEAAVGAFLGAGVLHPMRRPLTAEFVRQADRLLARVGATRGDLAVRAPDGVLLRGWEVVPAAPDGDWVLLFHGVSDNRAGMLGYAEFLLRHRYSLVMMDSRAQGSSGGAMATYGWRERYDTRATVDALYATENVHCLFALGESMGGAAALQSAAIEPRISGVVAEGSFSKLREVSYDYAGLHLSSWLGKTLFRPAVWTAVWVAGEEAHLRAEGVSPERAVAHRPFPVLLICGTGDHTIPCRHSERIFRAAAGHKKLWIVPGSGHAAALGEAPAEIERRVVAFLGDISSAGCGLPSAR